MSKKNNIVFEIEEKVPQQQSSISPNGTRIVESNRPIDKMVEEYVNEHKPVLAILTPCYGSVCFVNFVYCLLETMHVFQRFNIPIILEFCKNDSLVSRARNNLIAKSMSNPAKVTHFMFIDNDITWDPIDIIKLMLSNKSLCGGVYPLKRYNWEALLKDPMNPGNTNIVKSWIDKKNNSQLRNLISDEAIIQHNLLKYNTNFLSSVLTIDNNLTKVKHIATGFMMIKRETIEKMQKAYPQTKYVDDVGFLQGDENNNAYALFDCGVQEGHYYSEDWLFCHRWSKMGGNIYLDVSINLKHTGIEDYNGSFISTII